MTNLQEISALFNNKVKITNNGGEISVDVGLILIKEFLYQTNFKKLVYRNIRVSSFTTQCWLSRR